MALAAQDLPAKDFEVIVVDDGSRDQTRKVLEAFTAKHKNFHFFSQENQGQGIARNFGIKKAKGNIIVLIGDDIIVKKIFLSQHLRLHLRYAGENEAVLGLTLWHPRLEVTPFMKWMTNGSSVLGRFGGHQFAYEKLRNKKRADYNFFYTSNISLKRSLLKKFPFDPAFSGYGWEDIELGYRLHKEAGLKIYYNPSATGLHYHKMTEDGLAPRMRSIGRAAWIIQKKYPELKKVPSIAKRFIFRIISNPLSLAVLKLIRNMTQGRVAGLYYYALSKKYFLEGLNKRRMSSH